MICAFPQVVMCHSYESPICPKTISFTSTVFSFSSAAVTLSCRAMLSKSALNSSMVTGILSARIGTDSDNPNANSTPISMLRNCFIFFFLFQSSVRFKGEEKPGIISQIYHIIHDKRQQKFFSLLTYNDTINQHHNNREQHPHDPHQQVNL